MNKIIQTINKRKLIENNEHIVLGLSGGPDSVCLFNVLLSVSDHMNLTMHPVHINHKLRPEDAEKDQKYVEELCRSAGLTCRVFVRDCNRIAEELKMTSEEAGRKVRYDAFAQVAAELASEGIPKDKIKIAVAQNADDQAETILFRILRGTGTDGLSGISYERRDEYGNRIIRPLLDTTKKEVLEYCREKGLHPCIDKTNGQAIYTRNKIRLELIPYLEKEYNGGIKDTIIRMGKNAAVDKDFLWQTAGEEFEKAVRDVTENSVTLDGDLLRAMHRAIRQRVVSLALGKIGLSADMSFANFEGCEEIIFNEGPSARVDLPKGFYLTKEYSNIKVSKNQEPVLLEFNIKIISKEEYDKAIGEKEPGKIYCNLDFDKFREAHGENCLQLIKMAWREEGDYICIGENKKKKIQDYFVDRKIPKDVRGRVNLLKIGKEVLWISPWKNKGRFTAKYTLEACTKNVIRIEIDCVS